MSREIKFRGKRIDNGVWIDGDLVNSFEGIHIIGDDYFKPSNGSNPELIDVKPETTGQFTGLTDKNGKEIYEGDIIQCHECNSDDCVSRIINTFKNAVVSFEKGSFYYYPKGNMKQPHQLLMYAYEPVVIGNIHDNPELLNKP